ncbi:MAG TPA: hypothetical protein VL325_00975 [Pyrinomonadaceae bacterium]|nr:hypothetical protein [Pyrinomonadaceae bacterium]
MRKFVLGAVLGLIAGTVLVFLYLGGVPRAAQTPGVPIQPPDASGLPPGTAQIVLRQDFFNNVIGHILTDLNAPSFPLGIAENRNTNSNSKAFGLVQTQQSCDSRITILPEGSGVKTAINFANNNISAPLAFSGNYSSPLGCLQFTGWAQANFELRFDVAQQAVFGRINVETVNLDGVNPLISGFVTPLVQTSLNNRVNPIQIIKGSQLAVDLPIKASGGSLVATVKDVRAEVKDNAMNLYVIYDFLGNGNQAK